MKLLVLKTSDIPDTEIPVIREFLRIYFPVEIEVRTVSDGPWNYQEYTPGGWGIKFEEIMALADDANFICLLHTPDRENVISFAWMTPPGTKQYSQVNAVGGYKYNYLHELAHSLHGFYGQADRTHEFLLDKSPADFGGLYSQIQLFIPKEVNLLNEFVKKWSGKRIDFDGSLGAQCVDLYRQYFKEMGIPQSPGVQYAYQLYSTALLPKFKTGIPLPGDIVIWGTGFSSSGHVAINLSATSSSMKVFEQNNPPGYPCRVWDHPYTNVLGFLRPLMEEKDNETMLIRPIGSPEISYVDPKGIRHAMTAKAWSYYHSAAEPVEVSQAQYDKFLKGTPHFYSASFGEVLRTDREIWELESAEEIIG